MREERRLEHGSEADRDRQQPVELERELLGDLSPTDEDAGDVLGGTIKCGTSHCDRTTE